MNKSNATLKERLTGWTNWDISIYTLGACLGFWPDFGAPVGEDLWHGVKSIIWSGNPLGDAMATYLDALVKANMLERRNEPNIEYRWNPEYKDLD